MGRRVLPALLASLAAVADSSGAAGPARGALLFAVPFAAVAALSAFGDYLEERDDPTRGFQALMWALAVVLLVVSSAVRSSSIGVPQFARSTLVVALGIFAVKAFV